MYEIEDYDIEKTPYTPKPVFVQPSKSSEGFDHELSKFTYDNTFAYEFCDYCHDCGLCCCATFCLPCLLYSLFKKSKEGSCVACMQCTFCACVPCMPCCPNLSNLRTKIRGIYKLHGSIMEDKLYGLCFPCCAAIQLEQELRIRGESDA